MSVGRIAGLVMALTAVVAAVAFAVGAFDEEAAPATTSAAIGATSVAPSASLSSTTLAPATSAGNDPLCVAHEQMVAAAHGHLPVEGSDDLEIVRTASLAFSTEAVELGDETAQGAFAEFLIYEQAIYDFYEAFEWNPSPPLEELVANPPPTPPATATQTLIQVLEDAVWLLYRNDLLSCSSPNGGQEGEHAI